MNELFSNNLILIIAAAVVSLGGLGLLIIGLSRYLKARDVVQQRLQTYVVNPSRTNTPKAVYNILPRELSGSFFNRTIKPFFQNIIDFFGKFTPINTSNKSEFALTVAGNPFGMHAQEFYGVRVLFLFLGIGIAVLINYGSGFKDITLMIVGIGIIIGSFLLPRLWLDAKVRERKDTLKRNLPDALDMLSVCASAGLGFDQGLKKICEFWPTDLSEEFRHVLQEMDMGVSRADALRNMSTRLGVEEISSFIAIIVQAESIGMSFSEVLQSQAKQMRILRQFRAKEMANTLPAKMIIPIAIFIFPALIAVIIAPLIPTLMDIFS